MKQFDYKYLFEKTGKGLRTLAAGALFAIFAVGAASAATVDNENTALETMQQRISLTGRVTDTGGAPLIGVAVIEKGTMNGVSTGVDGSFSINVSDPNAVLVFSIIGFKEQEVAVRGRTVVNAILEESITDMDEVIVVAYGTQRKSSVTGSISTLKADQLKTTTSPNVNAMLQGKVAGVQVNNASGKPGEAAKIRIRGKSSLGGDSSMEPLWVIDGVISGTGAQLNPNEIETMSILKDAAATALYGSRATNGVIIVTTKSGRVGENRVDASAKFGFTKLTEGNFKLMNSPELYDYLMKMDKPNPGDAAWLNDKDKLLSHNTDWFDLATQTGFSQNYTVSHTKGTENMKSFLSGDYYNEEGAVRGYRYERFSIRSNNDVKLHDKVWIHTKIAGSFNKGITKNAHSLGSAMNYLPFDYPYNDDGTIRTGKEDDWYSRDPSNYMYYEQYKWERTKTFGVTGTFALDYRITDWLTFESNNNIGYRYSKTDNYVDPRSLDSEGTGGEVRKRDGFTTTRYTNQQLTFRHTFDQVHSVSAFFGYEYSDYMYESSDVYGHGIPVGGEVLDLASKPYSVKGNKSQSAMQSIYFNANYTYDNRYNAQVSYRRDGSSKFGKDKRYGNFWTVGGAWSIDQEQFMADVYWVDYLKLRASYGSIGNQTSLGNYSYLSTFNITTHYNNATTSFGDQLGNERLSWEKCYETNIAVDGKIFNRLGFTVEYYIKNTSDLLYQRMLNSLTGFKYRYENIGKLENKGWEITLDADIIKTNDWHWTASLNMGFNKNKVKSLANDNADQVPDTGINIFRVGEDRDAFYLPEWAGVDVFTGDPLWYIYDEATGQRVTTTSDIAQATRVIVGKPTPKFSGGISTSVSYKGITLSAIGNFMYGHDILHTARQFYDNDGAYPQYNALKLSSGTDWKRWEKPGDVASHPRAVYGGNRNSNQPSSRYLEDGSYFRLTNLTLSYDLPDKWMSKIGFRNAQVYFVGENLWTITKFSGTDVDVAVGDNNGKAGVGFYPTTRRFSFGVSFSF